MVANGPLPVLGALSSTHCLELVGRDPVALELNALALAALVQLGQVHHGLVLAALHLQGDVPRQSLEAEVGLLVRLVQVDERASAAVVVGARLHEARVHRLRLRAGAVFAVLPVRGGGRLRLHGGRGTRVLRQVLGEPSGLLRPRAFRRFRRLFRGFRVVACHVGSGVEVVRIDDVGVGVRGCGLLGPGLGPSLRRLSPCHRWGWGVLLHSVPTCVCVCVCVCLTPCVCFQAKSNG